MACFETGLFIKQLSFESDFVPEIHKKISHVYLH